MKEKEHFKTICEDAAMIFFLLAILSIGFAPLAAILVIIASSLFGLSTYV